jgi:quinone-modifying oxidoreductase subunit QmoA
MKSEQKPILVIGGGISGITAAVEIAETGKEVVLVEKEATLGGNVVRMNNYFPKLCPPACGLEINFRRIRQNPRIQYYVQTQVKELSGDKGNFRVVLEQEAQYVNDRCTSCGECTEVCPQERPDSFNYGFSNTKAIFHPHDMAFPNKYIIDPEYCLMKKCGKCLDICSYGAIDLEAGKKEITLEAEAIIYAGGWKNYDASGIEGLMYTNAENVITNVEFERLIAPSGPNAGKLLRPSDKKAPKEVAFVQCAGSRDENHLPYCSAVCCSASLKHALTLQEQYPDCRINIFYIDLRVSGRNEDFLNKVEQNQQISLIKGKVAKIEKIESTGNLMVHAEDILEGRKISLEADLVILATGIVPNQPGFPLKYDPSGFVDTEQADGIIPVACCRKPMDVSSSVKDATAAALKALQ